MASISRPSQAERGAWNARLRAGGGFTFADVSNAVTSAAVMRHQISTQRNTARRQVTRSSRASSRANDGFTTIARERLSPARSFKVLTRIRWISRCPDRTARCLRTGKRCCMSKAVGRRMGRALAKPIRFTSYAVDGFRCALPILRSPIGSRTDTAATHHPPGSPCP